MTTPPNFQERAKELWLEMTDTEESYGPPVIPILTQALEQAYRDGRIAGFEECLERAADIVANAGSVSRTVRSFFYGPIRALTPYTLDDIKDNYTPQGIKPQADEASNANK